jgi:hypothetical protein
VEGTKFTGQPILAAKYLAKLGRQPHHFKWCKSSQPSRNPHDTEDSTASPPGKIRLILLAQHSDDACKPATTKQSPSNKRPKQCSATDSRISVTFPQRSSLFSRRVTHNLYPPIRGPWIKHHTRQTPHKKRSGLRPLAINEELQVLQDRLIFDRIIIKLHKRCDRSGPPWLQL